MNIIEQYIFRVLVSDRFAQYIDDRVVAALVKKDTETRQLLARVIRSEAKTTLEELTEAETALRELDEKFTEWQRKNREAEAARKPHCSECGEFEDTCICPALPEDMYVDPAEMEDPE